MKKIILSVAFFCFLTPGVFPCSWCTEWKLSDDGHGVSAAADSTVSRAEDDVQADLAIPDALEHTVMPGERLESIDDEMISNRLDALIDAMSRGDDLDAACLNAFDESSAQMIDEVSVADDSSELSTEAVDELIVRDRQEVCASGKTFYNNYLKVYYPRALVVTDHFFSMCPEAISASLREVVDLLTKRPYFYFKNTDVDFSLGEYWEIILDQYKTITSFLTRAVVDVTTKQVVDRYASHEIASKNVLPLTSYWSKQGVHDYYAFYGHHCDYLRKMFLEGVETKNLSKARRYLREVERCTEKLKGSGYEVDYQGHLKRDHELMVVLRKDLGLSDG